MVRGTRTKQTQRTRRQPLLSSPMLIYFGFSCPPRHWIALHLYSDKMTCRCGAQFCHKCGSENARCNCTPYGSVRLQSWHFSGACFGGAQRSSALTPRLTSVCLLVSLLSRPLRSESFFRHVFFDHATVLRNWQSRYELETAAELTAAFPRPQPPARALCLLSPAPIASLIRIAFVHVARIHNYIASQRFASFTFVHVSSIRDPSPASAAAAEKPRALCDRQQTKSKLMRKLVSNRK